MGRDARLMPTFCLKSRVERRVGVLYSPRVVPCCSLKLCFSVLRSHMMLDTAVRLPERRRWLGTDCPCPASMYKGLRNWQNLLHVNMTISLSPCSFCVEHQVWLVFPFRPGSPGTQPVWQRLPFVMINFAQLEASVLRQGCEILLPACMASTGPSTSSLAACKQLSNPPGCCMPCQVVITAVLVQ